MSRITTSVTAIGVPDVPEPAPAAQAPVKKSSKPDTAIAPVAETEETP